MEEEWIWGEEWWGGRDEEERREGNCGKDGIYERRIKKRKNEKKTPSVVAAEVFS